VPEKRVADGRAAVDRGCREPTPPSILVRLGRLPLSDAAALAESVLLAGVCGLALRAVPFGRIVWAIGGLTHEPPRDRRKEPSAALVARLERLAGVPYRRSARGACLRESLVLFLMLKRRGVPSTLRIGVRTDEDGFAAHAWVTVPSGADGEWVADGSLDSRGGALSVEGFAVLRPRGHTSGVASGETAGILPHR